MASPQQNGTQVTGEWNFLHSEIQALPTTTPPPIPSISEATTTTFLTHMATLEEVFDQPPAGPTLVVDPSNRPDEPDDDSYAHPVRSPNTLR